MLNLWKDIVAIKRNFTEIQSATQRDLSKLRNDVGSVSNDVVATCSSMLTNTAQSMIAGVSSMIYFLSYENNLTVTKGPNKRIILAETTRNEKRKL